MTDLASKLVAATLSFVPELVNVPVLGRILLLFAPGGGDDLKAQEALEAAAQKTLEDRAQRIKRNARYVLKASEAMKCVEASLGNGGFLLSLGKALVNQVAGGVTGVSAPDLIMDRIFECIEKKVLPQTSKRTQEVKHYYGRPAAGHGKGRQKIPLPSKRS